MTDRHYVGSGTVIHWDSSRCVHSERCVNVPNQIRVPRPTSRSELRVNPKVAQEVATAYLDAADRPSPMTVAAFSQLVMETDRLFRRITEPARSKALRISFTRCENPYRDAHELIASVKDLRTLEITTVAAHHDRRHPLMSNDIGGDYDRFRAVHDALGHGRMQLGFDRDSEFAIWLTHERFHSPLARWALGTELHGQHSVRWTTGEMADPKATLLEPALLRRARSKKAQS